MSTAVIRRASASPRLRVKPSPAIRRISCGLCNGSGAIADPSPYASLRDRITCTQCGGRTWLEVPVASDAPGAVQFRGWDAVHQRHIAAIIAAPMSRPDLEAVYKRLVPDARQQIRLARKWGVWGVLAPDLWAGDNRDNPTAP